MKIVIVLCSLATFAIAVPVFQDNVLESSHSNQPIIKREKKSALLDITPVLSPEHGIDKTFTKPGQGTYVGARSFRKPIIIKRKLGYHVYRDSDEETAYAEPGEKCREQVKFKICDHEPVTSSNNGIKSTTFKCVNNYKTDNEMENSIKMARKAVEYLQKDLKRMENFSPKMANPQIEDIESNGGLHHDIEIAREALEHIEQNFESVNLEVNKVNELQIPKSQDVERLTRWREAIENIHKNFEVAKNIEEAFKTDRSDNQKAVKPKEPTNTELQFYVRNKFTNDNLENNYDAYNEDKMSKSASNEVGITQFTPKTENIDNIGKDVAHDMFISPTKNKEKKVQLHSDSLKSEINYKDASVRSDASEIEPINIIKYENEESKLQLQKSVPELQSYPMISKTITPNVDITDDQHLQKEEASVRSSESQNEKLLLNEYQEVHEFLPKRLDIERHPEEHIWQNYKSVPELADDSMASIQTEEVVITDDQQAHKQQATMRSSDSLTGKMKSNENQEVHEILPMALDIERHPEERTLQFSKSVPEMADDSLVSMPTEAVVIIDDPQAHREQVNMRSSDSLAGKMKSNENQEVHEVLPMELDTERHPEERTWQYSKSVPEMADDSLVSMPKKELVIIDDSQARREQVNMKSSDSLAEKMQSNVNQEVHEILPVGLNNERHQEERTWQYSKSVPEMADDSLVSMKTGEVVITDDPQAHREEMSMRSSETQNEKIQSSENQEVHEALPMGLDSEHHPEERTRQFSKSVPELADDSLVSMKTDEVVITDDPQAHREEVSMRSSETQNKKMQSSENQEVYKPLPMGLDSEHHPEERTWQFSKSAPEQADDSLVSIDIPTKEVLFTDNPQAYKEEVSMRSSESQNEKIRSSENQDLHEILPMELNIGRHPEERRWQNSKSVSELADNSMVLMPMENVVITDDPHGDTEETRVRTSENQNKKYLLNDYQEKPKYASTRFEIENNSDDTTAKFFKSVPELQPNPSEPVPSDKGHITNDQQSQREEASMRSSDSQSEKMQSSENQKLHEPLSMGLDIERKPEERTLQLPKSVPELGDDLLVSIPTKEVLFTDDPQAHKEEVSMRSSESQNEKLQFNNYQVEPKYASTRLDIENNSDDTTSKLLKSVPDLQPLLVESVLLNKGDLSKNQQSHREETRMRSSETQNEKMQSSENQEVHELLPLGLGIEHHSEERTWQYSKSVPELTYDSMVSMPTKEVASNDDQQVQKEEAVMRSSESQNEKLQINNYQEEPTYASTRLDIENNFNDKNANFLKAVPELTYDPMLLQPMEKVVSTDDQQVQKEETVMRSSESKNEKLQINDYQEEPKYPHTTRLDIKNNFDDTTANLFKSVPELKPYIVESVTLDKGDITKDQQSHREEAYMRSSDSQSENMESNDNQEVHEVLPMGLDIKRQPEERTWQYSKSVPEMADDSLVSMPTEEVVIIDHPQAHREQVNMRASDSLTEKMQSNENQEVHKVLPMGLDIERHPEERTWLSLKSVPEMADDSLVSMPMEEVVIIDHPQAHREQVNMRASDSLTEKMQSNENQEVHKVLPMGLDIERHPEERTWLSLKSVPEMANDSLVSMPMEEVVITDDTQAHREEVNMRASDSLTEKMQSNENQEVHKVLPMGLDIERHPEERTWLSSKSVPEMADDSLVSMPTEEVVITDDTEAHREEVNMRSSESQNEKLQINNYQEDPKYASTKLDIENNSDDTTAQLFKSVSELKPYTVESVTLDKGDITKDQKSHREEANMRSSDSQSENMQLNENEEVHELVPMGLDTIRHLEERTWQFSKSVPELADDSLVSMPTEEVVIIDDPQAHREEVSMRSSETKYEKMQSSANQEVHEPLPMGLDIEHHPEQRTWQFSKPGSELADDSLVPIPTEEVLFTDDTQAHTEEVSMRSSGSQNEKLQLNNYQEEPKYASTRLDIENNSDDTTSQILKSVPELQPFIVESVPLDKGDITKDQQFHGAEAGMRLSESQNEKLQLKDYQEDPKYASTRFDIENNSEDTTAHFLKAVPELSYDPMLLKPMEKVVSTDDQHAQKEDAVLRSSGMQYEKLRLNENQEAHEPLMIRLDMTNHPEDLNWPFLKSVPEFPNDPMLSMPSDNVEITNEHHFLKEGNMRFSQNQNERTQLDETHGLPELLPTKLENARLSQTENERQNIYFNHHLYEPHSPRLDNKKKTEDDSLASNNLRYNYIQNPIKDQAVMRLAQNQNDNKEIKYPSTSLGLSNDKNREDTAANIMNDYMSVAQPQNLYENRSPMLRSSNERQYLSHNFKIFPAYKMLPQTAEFEFSNGKNAHNEHINMRTNQEQSRDSDPIENQYIHNSHLMRWNTENQQDTSPNTYKSNLDVEHMLYKSNEFGNEQFITHEAPKTVNNLEYRTRPQLYGNHNMDESQSIPWFQAKQHNDHFGNYYKTTPEVQEKYSNPDFREYLHRVAVNHRLNDPDTFTSHDFPSSRARLHDHMQKYHQEKSPNTDSSMERSMHMNMRESFAKSGTEFNNMQFNHPHGTARFGAALPIAGVSPGAVGVFPTGNAGGCGIPLLLSCSPSVVSGSLARSNIAGPIFKSGDENFKYYIKRDAKNIEDVPDIKVQKSSLPHVISHGIKATSEM